MPIGRLPLLELWLESMQTIGVDDILVNLHYHAEIVRAFLRRPVYAKRVSSVYEEKLLGTAGTLRENASFFESATILLAHADNLCLCDFQKFVDFHLWQRPTGTLITMMTYTTPYPESCGIVELDSSGVVQKFHEKVKNPPGNLANAAIYLLEPEVLEWICENPQVIDFSTEVIPNFLGRIAMWKNEGTMRDIGTPESLIAAQMEAKPLSQLRLDEWATHFIDNPIHKQIATYKRSIP